MDSPRLLWVRLGHADQDSCARMRGRCSPESGHKWGGRIEAALGQTEPSSFTTGMEELASIPDTSEANRRVRLSQRSAASALWPA